MHRWLAAILTVVATAAPAAADTFYLPAAADAEGVNQTRWRTDVQIKAEGGDTAAVTLELLATGADNSQPASATVTVEAGDSLRLDNLLDGTFGATGTGAVRLTVTEGRIAATSRTYNDASDGTYGQTVPAVAEDDAVGHGTEATLIMLSRSPDPAAGFRTNLGLVNLTGSPAAIEIDLFAADGTTLGTVTRSLKPYEHRQLNDVFHMVGADDVPDGYAVVRTTTDTGRFLAYASVVDNGSGDAVFLLAHTGEISGLPTEPRLVVFEAFTRPACPICSDAKDALLQLKIDFQDQNVLILDQSVDVPVGDRLDRWFDAYNEPGSVFLPLVMIDSGNQFSNGDEHFPVVYARMIEDALVRPARAGMTVSAERTGDILRLQIELTNASGETLSAAANGATLTALAFEELTHTVALPFVPTASTTPITTLEDGATGEFTLEVDVENLDPDLTRWVVIADYRPASSGSAYDTLQAVTGP